MTWAVRCLIPVLVFCLAAPGVRAQQPEEARHDLVLRGVPLPEALESLVRQTQIDLVYDTDLVSDEAVFCVRRNATPDQLLQCVLAGTDLEYVRSLSGAYVLIPAVRRPAAHGSLAGVIVDAETGAPLPHAHVFLAEGAAGTATNESGLFAVAPLVSGPYRLTVTYVGYQTAVDSIYIAPGGQHRIQVALQSAGVTMPPVVVDGLEQRLPSQSLGSEEVRLRDRLRTSPFTGLDVARAAATLPGVSVQRPLADLHIQGGSAGSHVVLLDGAPVRDPVSLGRHLSAFSPLALGRMTIHRAGFAAAEGSNVTGQLALTHDLSVAGPAEVRATLDPISLNGRVATRFGTDGGPQGTALLAARTSVWDIYQEPYIDDLFRTWHAVDPVVASQWLEETVSPNSLSVLRQVPNVHFSDLHGAVRLRTSSLQSTEASFYRARNELGSTLAGLNQPTSDSGTFFATHDHYDWNNWIAQARHNLLLGDRSLLSVHAHGSWHLSEYRYGTRLEPDYIPDPDQREREAERLIAEAADQVASDESNRIAEMTIGLQGHHSLSRHTGISGGLDVTHVNSRFRVGGPYVSSFAYDLQAWHAAGYVEAELHAGVNAIIRPGLRVTYVPTRKETYLEPRLALRYDQAAGPLGALALRVSGGIYRQFVNEFELTSSGSTAIVPFVYFWLPVDETVAPPLSYHLAVDALLIPTPRWTASLSLYHKWNPRQLVLDYARLVGGVGPYADEPMVWLEQEAFVAAASGRSYGGDVRIRYDVGRWAVTGSYALSIVRRTIPGRFEDTAQPVHWNVPHTLHGGVRASLPAGVRLELDARLTSGLRWGYREAYYDYVVERYGAAALAPLNLSDPSADRLPASLSLDAGLSYERGLGPATAELRLLVINALNRNDIYERNAFGTAGTMTPIGRSLPGRHVLVSISVKR